MSYAWPPGRAFWTDEFPGQTSSRTAPYLFKNIIPPAAANPADVLTGLAAMRRAHAAGTATAARARVYVGEDRRDELIPTVLTAAAWNDGDFVPWMQSLVDADRFSLVINNLETVSSPLAAGLGTFLASLFDGWGTPIGGAEQVAFAGNYAGTAFGVHEGFEDAFLVHLGPGTKNFYCWSGEDYEKLTGGKEPLFGDYKWLLEHGELFVLEPGDALFLPRRVFHVGTQDTFSISVAVPLYTYPDARVLRLSAFPELFDSILAEGPDDELGEPSAMQPVASGGSPVARRLARLARMALDTASAQVETALEAHVQRRWDTVLSNGGWEVVDNDLARAEAAAAFVPARVVPGAPVGITAPYQLRVAGPQRAFLRGVEVSVDTSSLHPDLVATLNAGTPVTLPQDDAVLSSIRALGVTGGIDVAASSTESEDVA